MFKYFGWIVIIIGLLIGAAGYHWWTWQPTDARIDILGFLGRLWPDSQAVWWLKLEYDRRPLKVLLVPGHDSDYYGAKFGQLTEAELNLVVAEQLWHWLDQDKKFKPVTARDFATGDYIDPIQDYWRDNEVAILSHRTDLINLRSELLGRGDTADWSLDQIDQRVRDISFRLYGLNKWARDNQFDLVLHLHFNDYRGRPADQVGRFTGAAIYVPDGRFPNAGISRALAEAVFDSLTDLVSVSDLPFESTGIIDSQHLAAVAADPSAYAAAMLIEYGYIYEPQWIDPARREIIIPALAYQTYAGLKTFFEPDSRSWATSRPTIDGYYWTKSLGPDSEPGPDILALKLFLQTQDLYPPTDARADCPINGRYHHCLTEAVITWQAGILSQIGYHSALADELGQIGPVSLNLLNQSKNPDQTDLLK